MDGHPPQGPSLANNLQMYSPKLCIRPQSCTPPPRNFGVLGDPLSSRAAARTSLSPHWSRRSWKARGRGREKAPVEPEAATTLSCCACPGREPPRARRSHARDPPWPSPLTPLCLPHSRGRAVGSGRRVGSGTPSAEVARGSVSSSLLPTGRRGELELKLRPLLPQLPVPPRHAVAMTRDREREEARGQCGLSGDVVSHLWRERALECVFEM